LEAGGVPPPAPAIFFCSPSTSRDAVAAGKSVEIRGGFEVPKISGELVEELQIQKAALELYISSVLLIPKFAKSIPARSCQLWKQDTRSP
jgi:hypothetical protein